MGRKWEENGKKMGRKWEENVMKMGRNWEEKWRYIKEREQKTEIWISNAFTRKPPAFPRNQSRVTLLTATCCRRMHWKTVENK
jgi:hypothetical protein